MNIFNITKYPEKWDFLKQQLVPYRKKNKWGFVRYGTMDFVIDPIFDDARPFFEGFAAVKKHGGYGFINENGIPLTYFSYYKVKDFSEGCAAVAKLKPNNNLFRWTFIDGKGTQLQDLIYKEADSFSGGLAPVVGTGIKGYINKEFKLVIDYNQHPLDSRKQTTYTQNGIKLDKKDGLFGYKDSQNNLIIPHQFPFAKDFSEGLAVVEKSGNRGYITPEGETFIEMKYSDPKCFKNGLAQVFDKGYIDVCGIEYWED